VRAAWRGEEFLQRPGVAEAVTCIALTCAAQQGRHVRGSCEIAALLLFVLAPGATPEKLVDAEADAFWCLSELLAEVQGGFTDEAVHVKRAAQVQALLRTYDPDLAETLTVLGLAALPTTRLHMALCTRAGFGLADCVRIWDSVIADPRRFEFCDYVVVALLLLSRREMMQQRRDAASVAEVLLAAPSRVPAEQLLRTARAICAFERRCGADSEMPFPPRPKASAEVKEAAASGRRRHSRAESAAPLAASREGGELGMVHNVKASMRKLWAKGTGMFDVGRTATRCAFPQAQMAGGQGGAPAMPPVRRLSSGHCGLVAPTEAATAALEAGVI